MTSDTSLAAVRPHPCGRTAPGLERRVRRALGVLLALTIAVLIAAPAAEAATPTSAPAAAGNRVVLADPAPSPSSSTSSPGIGLGPGAPAGPGADPSPVTTTDPGTGGNGDPSWFDIPGQITKAIDDWFGSLIADALTPMLDLLGSTLLGTPDVTQMAGVERIWTQMALLANALYVLLALAGAVIVTTHGTAQSRFSAKEIVPRLAVGMIAGNASIALLALMIHVADAIASALLGGTIDPATAGKALGNLLGGSAGNSIFLVLLDLGAQVMLIAILLTYIVRVALTVILAVAAPLILSLHALPGPDALARAWWRAVAGLFLIQLGQSLVFVVALDVMLDPTANVSLFGLPDNSALVDTLVFLALCWILIKIPFWVGRSMLGGGGSRLWGMAKAVIAYKTLGAFGMRRGPGGFPVRLKSGNRPNRPRPAGGFGAAGGSRGPRRPGPAPSGGGGPVVYRVTQVNPQPPRSRAAGAIATVRPGLPAGSRAPTGMGPRLALEAGPSARTGSGGSTPDAPTPPTPETKHRQIPPPTGSARGPNAAMPTPRAPGRPNASPAAPRTAAAKPAPAATAQLSASAAPPRSAPASSPQARRPPRMAVPPPVPRPTAMPPSTPRPTPKRAIAAPPSTKETR